MVTLQKFPKNIPILIASFKQKFLYRCLSGLGFENIIQVDWGARHKLGDDFYIEIYPSDPECEKMGIDSYALFSSEKYLVGNFNDCPLSLIEGNLDKSLGDRKLDFLLFPYAGAGPYPQCFANLSEKGKIKEAAIKKQKFYDQACAYLDKFNPKFCTPFAGQYTLGGHLHSLNKFRGVPTISNACAYLQNYIRKTNLNSKLIYMSRGTVFDLEKECIIGGSHYAWSESQQEAYIEEILKNKKFSYQEEEEELTDLFPQLQEAYYKFNKKRKEINFKSDFKFYIDYGDSAYYKISFDNSGIEKVLSKKEFLEPYCVLKIDHRLLKKILNREPQYHWNNATVGSHVEFDRHPDSFTREPYYLLSFLHC
jgi:UDP-MurNAc hydroxylase